MKKKVFVLIFAVIAMAILSGTAFAIIIPGVTVVSLGNKGTVTVADEYSESIGISWETELVNGNKVGTDRIMFINNPPFNNTNLKAGYRVVANEGYYIDGFYRSQDDYDNGNNGLDNIEDFSDTSLYTLDANGFLIAATISGMTFPEDTFYISYAEIPSSGELTVVLVGNNGTATVASEYSESTSLVWETGLVNGNKVGTDTITHIMQGPFNATNLKAGYRAVANEGYYIRGFYRSQADYNNRNNGLDNIEDFTDTSLYTFDANGFLTTATITEVAFPDDTFYIDFAEIPEKITKVDSTTGIGFEAEVAKVPANTVISVEKVTSGENFNKINIILGDNVNEMAAYNISLLSNGVKIQPKGNIKVYLPIPSGFDISNLTVYYINTETGAKESFDVTIETIEGIKYAVFETNHFSTYILAEKKEKDDTPKTGSKNNLIEIASITSIISLAGIIVVKKRQQ